MGQIAGFGDQTTTRGRIAKASSTMSDDGKTLSLSGDRATCGICKGGVVSHIGDCRKDD